MMASRLNVDEDVRNLGEKASNTLAQSPTLAPTWAFHKFIQKLTEDWSRSEWARRQNIIKVLEVSRWFNQNFNLRLLDSLLGDGS